MTGLAQIQPQKSDYIGINSEGTQGVRKVVFADPLLRLQPNAIHIPSSSSPPAFPGFYILEKKSFSK